MAKKRIGRFTAVDEDGSTYTIETLQERTGLETAADSETVGGARSYQTVDGVPVRFVSEGTYEILTTPRVRVRTREASA